MPAPSGIRTATDGDIFIVTIDRPQARNAVDRPTADALYDAFKAFDTDDALSVAILTGANGNFCAGADLKAVAEGRGNKSLPDGDYGPMGPSRLELTKPVIAAVDGYAVAGGLELACWCDLRVASPGAKFGVFCRRFGVPLIDGGTIRLPRLIGASRAMDMILTGREVGAEEALSFGLANYVSDEEGALPMALDVARRIAAFPQFCMRTDRASALAQWSLPMDEALRREIAGGLDVIKMGETRDGAKRFAAGIGRGGLF
ncbi:crotonase/enoyl-CoA hydratase family protein [uncultured Hyphomonas sp.]|uniref:crotonase/enoyl-CoA hydratase family protein n=1 Tax=uncultured Hyphomonas sp. TaxID=225298 RepID=UPI002AAACB19|nr:crotonase/enoyl-CoA hydratase family protein [uncultured Hyphomonas sp.]